MNMQQSPEPDRPQFRIPFTVTDGPAVLPPPIDRQVLSVPKASIPGDNVAVWADPPAGIVGSRAAIQAKGLPTNTEVTLTWSTTVGKRVSGSGWDEQVAPLTTARTDASGALRWTLTVPDDLGGAHVLAVKQGDKTLAQTDFVIQPSGQRLTLERGPPGTEVMIQLNGVGWTETANVFNLVYDNAHAGYACGFNSNGNVQIFLRVSGAPGWHFIPSETAGPSGTPCPAAPRLTSWLPAWGGSCRCRRPAPAAAQTDLVRYAMKRRVGLRRAR